MSDFLHEFLSGKVTINNSELGTENEQLDMDMAPTTNQNNCSLSIVNHQLSIEAQAVYDAGLELWKYYHAQAHAEPNASFYDIRKHFQGVNDKGKMNASSSDERYTQLISDLREKQKTLGKRIEAKTYEYGFLR